VLDGPCRRQGNHDPRVRDSATTARRHGAGAASPRVLTEVVLLHQLQDAALSRRLGSQPLGLQQGGGRIGLAGASFEVPAPTTLITLNCGSDHLLLARAPSRSRRARPSSTGDGPDDDPLGHISNLTCNEHGALEVRVVRR